jgi:hypothetical protein
MLLLKGYIPNFTCARYYFRYVEFSDFLCQPISGWTNFNISLISEKNTFFKNVKCDPSFHLKQSSWPWISKTNDGTKLKKIRLN